MASCELICLAEQEGFEACDDGNNNNADGCVRMRAAGRGAAMGFVSKARLVMTAT